MPLSFSVLLRTFHRPCSWLGDFCWQCFVLLLSLLISASLYTYTVRLLAVVLALSSTCWFPHSYVGRPVRTLYSNVPETYWLPYSNVDGSVRTLYSNVPETYWLPYSNVHGSVRTLFSNVPETYRLITSSFYFNRDAKIDWLRHRSIETSIEMRKSIDYVISIDWLRHRSIETSPQSNILLLHSDTLLIHIRYILITLLIIKGSQLGAFCP